MTRSTVLAAAVVSIVGIAATASAETAGQFAAPGVRAPSDPHVNGFRFSLLYGNNERMEGLDVGLLSVSETTTMSGVGLVMGLGKVNGDMDGGAAFSLINLHKGRDTGLNAAFINKLADPDGAVTVGFVNIADGKTLVDVGGVNVSGSSRAQLGFINITDRIDGFQLGFINVARNGFLPVFPFFNFASTESSD